MEDFSPELLSVYTVRNQCRNCTADLPVDTNHRSVRSLPLVLGYGVGLAVVLGAFDFTGGALHNAHYDPTVDQVEAKEALRKTRRKPLAETIAELGEGRGKFNVGRFFC